MSAMTRSETLAAAGVTEEELASAMSFVGSLSASLRKSTRRPARASFTSDELAKVSALIDNPRLASEDEF